MRKAPGCVCVSATHVRLHAYTCTRRHTRILYTHTFTQTYRQECAHEHMYAYICTRRHTRICNCIYVHTHANGLPISRNRQKYAYYMKSANTRFRRTTYTSKRMHTSITFSHTPVWSRVRLDAIHQGQKAAKFHLPE